jgi:outer membrane lipoprotein-sorting protein
LSNGAILNDVQGDDLLERSIEAIKHERMPSGPSQDVIARTLETLKPAPSHNERKTVVTRILQMTFAQRIAAAVMLTGGALVLWFMFALFGGFGTVSYAQVAQHIKEARSMTFKMTITSPKLPKPVEAKLYALEPGKMRNEGPGGVVTISRREADKVRTLALMPQQKQARAFEIKLSDPKLATAPDFVNEFRKLADHKGEALEPREINGTKAKGFRVVTHGQVSSLWVDPKTAQPLLVEMDVPAAGEGAKVVMSEIAFDVPLDESLFSLDPPKDYTLEKADLAVSMNLEANLINVFRVYADANGGTFPERFDDWSAYAKAVATKSQNGKLDPEAMKNVAGIGTVTALLSNKKAGEDYAYSGKEAKLGEKDKLIFWYRDKEKGTYRAIFADLTARDVPAEEVQSSK